MSFAELDLVILKALITNKKHALNFANSCESKLFSPDVWVCANHIVNYIKTYKDLPTLKVLTEKLYKTKNNTLIEHVTKVWEHIEAVAYDDKEYAHNLEKIKKRFAEKQVIAMRDSLAKIDPTNIDISKSVSEMQQTTQNIRSLTQAKAYERRSLRESVPIFRDEYNAKMENPEFDRGIYTGYSFLDFVTDGLRDGELLLIGGESGSGKSLVLMNMALQIWLQQNNIFMREEEFGKGYSVLFFSLEMPFKPCLNRVLARLSGNPSKLIRNAKLNSEQAVKLRKALKFISRYPYEFEIIDIPRGATMRSLEVIYEEAVARYDSNIAPKVIVIDYLGLMDYEGGTDMDDWLKLGKISEEIHEFSRVHNAISLSAVQLNRLKGGKDIEAKVGLHRIGRSALIMQNANIGIQLNMRPNEKDYPDMEYYIIKNREGELGKGRMIKNLACGTLLDDGSQYETNFETENIDDISGKLEDLD